MRAVEGFVRVVGNISSSTGIVVSFMVLPMTFILVYEVFMRYFLNSPTIWAHETVQFFYGGHFMLGGAYALFIYAHVRIDVLVRRFSARTKAIISLCTWPLFYLFVVALLFNSARGAASSLACFERTNTVWAPPYWPIRLAVPVAAGLILIQGVAITIGNFYTAFTGRSLVIKGRKEGVQ